MSNFEELLDNMIDAHELMQAEAECATVPGLYGELSDGYEATRGAVLEYVLAQSARIAELEAALIEAIVEAADQLNAEPFRSWFQERLRRDHPEHRIAIAVITAITTYDRRIVELEEALKTAVNESKVVKRAFLLEEVGE